MIRRAAKLRDMPGWLSRPFEVIGWASVAARRRVARASLFTAVAFAVILGAAIAAGVTFAIWIALNRHLAASPPSLVDVVKTALTVVAGVGGAVALVVAYRRQRDLEQGRFVERFGAAAAQLGNPDVAVRIAGVYAMAGVADESRDLPRRQQCVDVLCGYVRLPFDPDSSSLEKMVRTSPGSTNQDSVERQYQFRQHDREVRQTILRTIAAHVHRDAENSWSSCRFDFRNAVIEDLDFVDARISGEVNFAYAVFHQAVNFRSTVLSRANFGHAKFKSNAAFNYCKFTSLANFSDVYFEKSAWFQKAEFHEIPRFTYAKFMGADTIFHGATFNAGAAFSYAEFAGRASFYDGTKFGGHAGFNNIHFNGPAQFGGIRTTVVEREGGSHPPNPLVFEESVTFANTQFVKGADFHACIFRGNVIFEGRKVTRADGMKDEPTKFVEGAVFEQAAFEGSGSFKGVDFGTAVVSFQNPGKWSKNLHFDWSDDISRKPTNVKPDEWPPTPKLQPTLRQMAESAEKAVKAQVQRGKAG
jgi:uncharacterized protein YjbI with pentapeptide repeats